MKEENTYYEKILVTSGEVPETGMHFTNKGHIHFFGEKWFCENRDRFVVPEWYLKPVPSPKQEVVEFELSKIDETIILGCISGNVGYALPSDCIKAKNEIVEFLKTKFKEKGEK